MDINYLCSRKRKEFGHPCIFSDIEPSLLSEIDSNPELKNGYIGLDAVTREIDNSPKFCAHEVNTVVHPTESRGMNHMEGGWPASVDNTDEESMARFRKKIEKDKSYINAVKSLADFLEYFIMENNSNDIYEEYFEGERIKRDTDWSMSVVSVFKDLNAGYRSAIDLSCDRNSTKFAVAYGLQKKTEYPVTPCIDSYVWDIENSIKPLCILKPEVPMTVVEFCSMDENLILGGFVNGQVAVWDIRTDGFAQQLSTVTSSHNAKVTGAKWLKSKKGTTFFSASFDGTLMSWDSRNLSSPIEKIHFDTEKGDIPNLSGNYTVSCIEYDATVPDQFMLGTDQGEILSFRRKSGEDEERLSSTYNCLCGPVLAIERNAFYPQLFASCDAWYLKLWSENLTDFPILNVITQDDYFTGIAWSPTRASTLFATKTSGSLEVWDFPGKTKEALLSVKLEKEPLLSVSVMETGNKVVCGTFSGSVHLINVPEYLRSSSELEQDLVKNCIKECPTIIGGKTRLERILDEELESPIGMDEDWWDPPDKAEDLYEENKTLFEGFPPEEEEN